MLFAVVVVVMVAQIPKHDSINIIQWWNAKCSNAKRLRNAIECARHGDIQGAKEMLLEGATALLH